MQAGLTLKDNRYKWEVNIKTDLEEMGVLKCKLREHFIDINISK
jgi:hypothetical protein